MDLVGEGVILSVGLELVRVESVVGVNGLDGVAKGAAVEVVAAVGAQRTGILKTK